MRQRPRHDPVFDDILYVQVISQDTIHVRVRNPVEVDMSADVEASRDSTILVDKIHPA
jgi:hypothetical protein